MTLKSLNHRQQKAFSPQLARQIREGAIAFILFLAAFSSVATMAAILFVLISESLTFFQQVPIGNFFTDTQWTPLFAEKHYGIFVLLSGTIVTSAIALTVAIPLGTIAALYLSEFAAPQLREIVKPFLELLAGVPTVVYGYFALLFITPLLQVLWPDLPGFNRLSAGLVMGIMLVPFVCSIGEDALQAVPLSLREGSYATGATRLQTARAIVYPAAVSGIAAAYILAASRALGETMIVTIAAGLEPKLSWNPAEGSATITAYIAQVSLGDLPHGSLEYQTIFAAGLILVLMTLVLNILGHFLAKYYREIY